MSESEAAIIARCQSGDKNAYGTIVDLYKEKAYHIALGIRRFG